MGWFDGLLLGLAVGFVVGLLVGGLIKLILIIAVVVFAVLRIQKMTRKTDQKHTDGRIGGWNS